VAGRMLVEDERVREFMSWEERAGVLARNAIGFLGLGEEFERRYEERLLEADGVSSDGLARSESSQESVDGTWEGWRTKADQTLKKIGVDDDMERGRVRVVDSDLGFGIIV